MDLNGHNGHRVATIGDLDEEYQRLVLASVEAKERAYCPYSHFHVGSALLTKSGEIFKGCNMENAAYSMTVCAERVAIGAAVAYGHRHFTAIAIASDSSRFTAPCGACRQSIVEFGKDCKVILVKPDKTVHATSIRHLLPMSFGPHDLLEEQITSKT